MLTLSEMHFLSKQDETLFTCFIVVGFHMQYEIVSLSMLSAVPLTFTILA